jgi:hypothetical protein
MVEGFSLGNYLLLVDFTARLYREGKMALSRDVTEILDRLGSTGGRHGSWWNRKPSAEISRPCNPMTAPFDWGHDDGGYGDPGYGILAGPARTSIDG